MIYVILLKKEFDRCPIPFKYYGFNRYLLEYGQHEELPFGCLKE